MFIRPLILLTGLVGLAGLRPAAAGSAGFPAPLRVAVVPAEPATGRPAGMAAFARGTLSRELARSGSFVLVERERVDRLLQETGMAQSGITRGTPEARLGLLLDVGKLLFVDVQFIFPHYTLTVRIVDVKTGKVQRVESTRLGLRTDQAQEPLERLARRLAGLAPVLAPPAMVLVPGGVGRMGSSTGLADEQPVHAVHLDSFYLDRFEVTRIEFHEWLVAAGKRRVGDISDPFKPATGMTWHQAAAYCRARGRRLPTEAEWEFAARGPEGHPYPWGQKQPDDTRASFARTAHRLLQVHTLAAGATPLGVHHMAGNVAEWVHDWWSPDYYTNSPRDNPRGPASGDYKAVRGGAYNSPITELRATARGYHNPERGAAHIGFRCARDVDLEIHGNRAHYPPPCLMAAQSAH